jgi:serine protease Do
MLSRCRACLAIFCSLPLLCANLAHAQPMRTPDASAAPAGSEPGYLGMIGDDRQENGRGVRVQDVDPDSPAAKAGLRADDLITAINGQPIHSDEDLAKILQPLSAGTKVTFQIQRQNQTQNVEATLDRRPPPEQRRYQSFGRLPNGPLDETNPPPPASQSTPPQTLPGQSSAPNRFSAPGAMSPPSLGPGSLPRPLLGVRTMPVTDQDRMRLGLPSVAGAHVMDRTPGSPAESANIPVDSVITALNGSPINTPNDLSALLARAGAGTQVEVTYFYNGNSASTKVVLGFPGASRDMGHPAVSGAPSSSSPTSGQSNWPPPTPMTTNSPRTIGAPNSQSADAQRIDALERRIQQLEQKVNDLESRQQH